MPKFAADLSAYELMVELIGEEHTARVFEAFAGSNVYFPVRFTPPTREAIVSMFEAGHSMDQIARNTHTPRSTLYRILKSYNPDQLDLDL